MLEWREKVSSDGTSGVGGDYRKFPVMVMSWSCSH
jgi:hypothetical protein